MAESMTLKYVSSSSTLFCCHCTEDNCSRCQGEEWILPGWLWPSYLSLGHGTDAGSGVTFSPLDSCSKRFSFEYVYEEWQEESLYLGVWGFGPLLCTLGLCFKQEILDLVSKGILVSDTGSYSGSKSGLALMGVILVPLSIIYKPKKTT